MTRDEIVVQVQLLLGFRTDQLTSIIAQIAVEQQKLEREVKWLKYPAFLVTERAATAAISEEQRVEYPTDWIADVEEDAFWVVKTDGTERALKKREDDVLRYTYRDSDPGLPKWYSQDGRYYRLYPTPDQAYALKMKYYAAEPVVTDGADTNRWMTYAPNLIIGRVGMFLSGAANNARRDMFAAMAAESKSALETKAFDLETTNRQYAMGENM